ncbi:peptidylprolyl isomerase [Pseudogemmobacter sp. W21_MBD1_M6]|uniref:peptidylprolyl isomerase n=1 Tax=Pseudogemmobacter sp. W21_MBD1_M6 TaxID=3240271 RepID=UPI003F95163B
MSKRNTFVLGATLSLFAAFPVFAAEITADTVVATVNGEDITVGHMIVVRSQLPEQYRDLADDVLYTGILDQLVQQTVLAQSLGKDLPKRAVIALDNERRALLAGEVIDGMVSQPVSDEALKAAYDERFAAEAPTKEFNASHILLETEEAAKEVRTLLDDGADFATLAKEKSTGPSGPNGGELGWFGPGMMVKEFEDAVVALEPGQLSQPVQTQFGWHILKLNETRMKDAPSLDEMREELTADIQRQTVESSIAAMTEKATVIRTDAAEIDAAALKNLDLLNN